MTREPNQVRLGFVGGGFMGQLAHIRNYAALPYCELVALADPRSESASAVAKRYGIEHVYSNVDEMLGREELDGVVATVMFDRHADLLPSIYGRVPFVFTEKPLADSSAAGRELAAAAETSGTVHMLGYHKRCDPAVSETRDLIRSWKTSELHGDLRYIRVTVAGGDWIAGAGMYYIDRGEPKPPFPVSDSEPRRTYVEFVNFFIHQVNLLRYLLGEDYSIEFADPAGRVLCVRSASGVTCVIELRPFDLLKSWHESVLVAFERATITLSLPAPLATTPGEVEIRSDEPRHVREHLQFGPTPAMLEQARAFASVCTGDRNPPCDIRDALRDLELADEYVARRFPHVVPA
jgi:predicted dehydrogenase